MGFHIAKEMNMEILLIFLKISKSPSPINIPSPKVGSSAMSVPSANPMAIECGDVFNSITSFRCCIILFFIFFIICLSVVIEVLFVF